MKKFLFVFFLIEMLSNYNAEAQDSTVYSFSLASILNDGGSVTLNNGVTIKVTKFGLGTGVPGPADAGITEMGWLGPDIGGTFNGTCMAAYTGTTSPVEFTKLSAVPDKIEKGSTSPQCKNAVGFWIQFSEPVKAEPFLMVDLDGNYVSSGNGNREWETVFGYNTDNITNKYVDFNITRGSSVLTTLIDAGASTWKQRVNDDLGAAAAADFPAGSSMKVAYRNTTDLTPAQGDPDNVNTQALFTPTGQITDLYVLWGVWDDISGASAASDRQNSGVSPIVVKMPTFVMPLNLISFTGKVDWNNNIGLNWKTESEVNTNRFEIQQSANGQEFSAIGTTPAIGSGSHTYSFTARASTNGVNYYRLKMVDMDGTYTFSPVVKVKVSSMLKKEFGFSISNNPVTNNMLQLNFAEAGNYKARVYNALGKLMAEQNITDASQASINCSIMSSGVYFVRVANKEGKILTSQFIKQ